MSEYAAGKSATRLPVPRRPGLQRVKIDCDAEVFAVAAQHLDALWGRAGIVGCG